DAGRRYLAWLGGLVVLGFFVLGFFADTQRVSFHWPLPGYLALLPLLPALLDRWAPWLRRTTWAVAACGLLAVLGYYAAGSTPSVREQTAALKWYPSNFAGWDTLAAEVQRRRAEMPEGTRLVAGNFKIGAELGFALGEPDIPVLPHPLNREHGRAPQLRLWGLRNEQPFDRPTLLVAGATDVEYKNLLQRYHALCAQLGPLPAPHALNIDHGAQRYVLFESETTPAADDAPSTPPAMACLGVPVRGGRVEGAFDDSGWALKDGVGLSAVEVLLDGKPVATAEYGLPRPGPATY